MEGITKQDTPKAIAEKFLEMAKMNLQRDGYLANMIMAMKREDKNLDRAGGMYCFPFEFETPEEKEVFFKRTALYMLKINPDIIVLVSEGWMVTNNEKTVAPLSVSPSQHPNKSEIIQVIVSKREGSHGVILEFGRDKEGKIHFGKPTALVDDEDNFSMDKNTNFGRFSQTWKSREKIAKFGDPDMLAEEMLKVFLKKTGCELKTKKIDFNKKMEEDENGS